MGDRALDVLCAKDAGVKALLYLPEDSCVIPTGLEDRIEGLNAGADYYLTKPFDMRELLACINAMLRRQGSQVDEMVFGNTALDLATSMLICGVPAKEDLVTHTRNLVEQNKKENHIYEITNR